MITLDRGLTCYNPPRIHTEAIIVTNVLLAVLYGHAVDYMLLITTRGDADSQLLNTLVIKGG